MLMEAFCFDWNQMKKDGYDGFILERKNWTSDPEPHELWHWDFDVDTIVLWGGGFHTTPHITPAPLNPRKRKAPYKLDIQATQRMLGHAHMAIGVHMKDPYYRKIGAKILKASKEIS
jgi:hypothetical protein